MRRLAGLAAVGAIAFAATAVMAASPSPSPSTRPSAIPTPSATPAPAKSPAPTSAPSTGTSSSKAASAAPTNDWTASVAPVQITGSVTVHRFSTGGGIVRFKLNDLLNETGWSIRLERGTVDGAATRTLIAARSSDEARRFNNDTIEIRLDQAEMGAFMRARTSAGVVVFVSDGSRLSVATFPAS